MTSDNNDNFVSPAWLLEGITGAVCGSLKLVNGRLSFAVGERKIFNVPLSEVKDVAFPWYYFSGGVKFKIGTGKYRLSFVEPNSGSGRPDVGGARRTGKIWKSLLQA